MLLAPSRVQRAAGLTSKKDREEVPDTRGIRVCSPMRRSISGEQVLEELRILQHVQHPNLVSFCVRESADQIEIRTFPLEGGTLFELLHGSGLRLSVQQKEKAALDIAHAMQYLHTCDPPIVHGDLSSLNLLLPTHVAQASDPITVKVANFGRAWMQGGATTWRAMGRTPCPERWTAPEVLAGKEHDTMSDTYSYGMVLYEIMCQELPFKEHAAAAIPALAAAGERPSEVLLPEECHPLIKGIMADCWAQDPFRRPQFFEVSGVLVEVANLRCPRWANSDEEEDDD